MIEDLLHRNAPGRNSKCLCGSDLKFKKCCSGLFIKVEPNSANEYLKKNDFHNALICSRAFLTQYLLLNKVHTQRAAKIGGSEDFPLFQIDIDALDDALQEYLFCLEKNSFDSDWPLILFHLDSNTDSPRLKELFSTKLAEWYYFFKNDRLKAFEKISKFSPFTSLSVKLVGLHLDLNPVEIPFSQKIILIDRILQFSKSSELSLHYSVSKGIAYCMINDNNTGTKIIANAIGKYKSDVPEDGRDNFALLRAMLILPQFGDPSEFLLEVMSLGERILNREDVSLEEKAETLINLGDAHHYAMCFEKAEEYYKASYVIVGNELCQIFLARSLAARKEILLAREVLTNVIYERLTGPNCADFALVWANLALLSKEKSDICIAKEQLKKTDFREPYFVSIRDKLLVEILEVNPVNNSSLWDRAIDFVTKYFHLKPNLCGLGLDINSILRDLKTTRTIAGDEAHQSEEKKRIK